MKVKKLFAIVLTTAMVLGLTACGDSAAGTAGAGTTGAETVSSDKTQALNVCLASEPATLDPALNSSVDGATMCLHLFSGIAKWEQDDAGNLVIVPDCAVELPEGVANEDGTMTYTYTLRDLSGLTARMSRPAISYMHGIVLQALTWLLTMDICSK